MDLTSFFQIVDVVSDTDEFSEEINLDQMDLDGTDCDGQLPKQDKLYLSSIDEANLKQKSRLFVKNGHIFPVWLTLLDIDSLEPVSSFFIVPSEHSKLKLPVGEYLLEVQSGSVWCNLEQGFEDAVFLEPEDIIAIIPNQVKHITIDSYGVAPSDMMFMASQNVQSLDAIKGNGTLVLQKVLGGSYIAPASVNQKPATFIVDTGASITTVPYDFGKHAKIKGCKEQRFVTPSGFTKACVGIASELTVGQFVLKDVKIAYGKAMPKDTFLLGMNVLSQFKIVQEAGSMVLSRK